MKGKHFFTSIFIACMLAFTTLTPANAEQYAGVAYVATDYEIDTPFNEVLTDDTTTGLSIFYGHVTSRPWLFWEVDYTDFGDTDSTYTDGNKYVTLTEKYEYNAKALSLWAVGKYGVLNINNKPLKVVGRVGASVVDATGRGSLTVDYTEGPTYKLEANDSDTGVGLAYGIGLEYNVYSNLIVSADWRKRDVDLTLYNENLTFDASTYQVGLAWAF